MGTRLKLTGDPCLRTLRREKPSNETIEEAFFTCADLTGRDLVIAPPAAGSDNSASVAYVRCEPLPAEQAEQIDADRKRSACRKVIAYIDSAGRYADFHAL